MNFSKKRPVKIVMLGAGGTGAHIAPHLYRLLYALERPVKFIICDGDKVEPKNLVRQNFTEADLGENKARVIAERYSDVFGLETSYIPRFIEDAGQLEELLRPEVFRHYVYGSEPNTGRWVTNSELVILIGAVDNNKSRIIAFRSHTLWLELALVGLLLLLMAAHGKYSMAVKWAVGYCALLLFQQYILPASPKIIATSFTIFATYARRMFPCLMTGSLMLKCTPLRYFIVGLRQLRVPQRLIVAVSVTLRYFPAIREEMGYIRDAMKLRDVRGLARLEGTVIPLMVSATETAEELSAAAVTRGIEDPAPKTSAVFLRLSPVDLAGMAAGLVLLALSFVVQ